MENKNYLTNDNLHEGLDKQEIRDFLSQQLLESKEKEHTVLASRTKTRSYYDSNDTKSYIQHLEEEIKIKEKILKIKKIEKGVLDLINKITT